MGVGGGGRLVHCNVETRTKGVRLVHYDKPGLQGS